MLEFRRNYCTLFDSNYMSRGLALYESLLKHAGKFQLYVYAWDQLCYDTLHELSLENITVISLKDFEDDELLRAKKTRNAREYFWTCTPSVILHSINNYNLAECTYLDSDIFFYNSPDRVFDEIADQSVMITPHRFSAKYIKAAENGIYNVQFMYFKNNPEGMTILKEWRRQCNEWCYAIVEKDRFGDQKYLNSWPDKYETVHVLQNLHTAIGPWNIQQYEVIQDELGPLIRHADYSTFSRPIFYHFHNLRIFHEGYCHMVGYDMSQKVVNGFYTPYIKSIMRQENLILKVNPGLNGKGRQSSYQVPFEVKRSLARLATGAVQEGVLVFDTDVFNQFMKRKQFLNTVKRILINFARKLKHSLLNQ